MSFDKRVHTTYYNTTKSTISPPLYTTFVDRPHNGFHILFFLVNQLKTRAHELYVRLYSVDGTQHAHPPRTHRCPQTQSHSYPNLINDTIISISLYVFHLRDADHPVLTIILQDLLHTQSFAHLLGLHPTSLLPQHGSSFPS